MTTINKNRGNRDRSHGRSFDRGQPSTTIIFLNGVVLISHIHPLKS